MQVQSKKGTVPKKIFFFKFRWITAKMLNARLANELRCSLAGNNVHIFMRFLAKNFSNPVCTGYSQCSSNSNLSPYYAYV